MSGLVFWIGNKTFTSSIMFEKILGLLIIMKFGLNGYRRTLVSSKIIDVAPLLDFFLFKPFILLFLIRLLFNF